MRNTNVMPEHRFNSDGRCKDCGISELTAADRFCDGSDDLDLWLTEDSPAYRPTVAGYLAGLQYLASIRKL